MKEGEENISTEPDPLVQENPIKREELSENAHNLSELSRNQKCETSDLPSDLENWTASSLDNKEEHLLNNVANILE
jgi:hypothetical protein